MNLTPEAIESYRQKASAAQHAGVGSVSVNTDELLSLLDEVLSLRDTVLGDDYTHGFPVVAEKIHQITPFRIIFVAAFVYGLYLLSGCRLATPDFKTGSQTNSVGEVWTPGK